MRKLRTLDMQTRISPTVKSAVIEDWLKAMSRDAIAVKEGISGGTVSNIVQEWRGGLDDAVADELREFAVALHKLKISAPRCALGARVASLMSSLGMKENDFQTFMSETYDRCLEVGLKPEKVAYYLKQVLDLCDSMPLEQIPDHIEQQITRKQQLEEEIQILQAKELESRKRVDIAMKEEAVSLVQLDQFSDFKTELNKEGITLVDVSMFAKTVNGVRQLGYDPQTIVSKVSDLELLQILENKLKDKVEFLKTKKNELELDCTRLEGHASVHTLALSNYRELESMGLGLKELKLLCNIIREIAAANNILEEEAIQKFSADVERQYDPKLGFESTVESLKSEIRKHETAVINQSAGLVELIRSIMNLSGGGIGQAIANKGDKFQDTEPAGAQPQRQQVETKTPRPS